MRAIDLLRATIVIFAFSAGDAYAMCGHNLSPSRSPYALSQPQAADVALATPASDLRAARLKATQRPQ